MQTIVDEPVAISLETMHKYSGEGGGVLSINLGSTMIVHV